MKIINLIFIFSLFFTPAFAHAEAPSDLYADAIYAVSSATVYQPSNSLGAPDGAYADFFDELAYVTLDMGEDEEGTGDLTLTYLIQEIGAAYKTEFMDVDLTVLQTSTGTFATYSTETSIDYTAETAYRYVKVTCIEDELWRLDSVTSASVSEEEEVVVEEEPSEEQVTSGDETDGEITEPVEEEEEESSARGMLVKLVDDGDAITTVDAAVYVIGEDGMRHAFSSETVYRSWFQDFEDVAYIDPTNLASYQLGDNVTIRPGTYLVKITTDPKVYAVEPGGVLRWVASEEIAIALYGSDWAERVVDVSDIFWNNYTVGDAITSATPTDGSIAVNSSTGEVLYLSADEYFSLGSGIGEYMRFNTDYYISITESTLSSYVDGGELEEDPEIAYPF